jgi:hypothetical protein
MELQVNVLVDFFTLRPVFTHNGLTFVWYAYLLNVIIQTYNALHAVIGVLAQRGVSWEAWWPNFIPLLLQNFVQLLLVRVLIEVAATILSNARRA